MIGFFLHLTAACVIVIAISLFHYLAIPLFAGLGYFWEKTQHRYVWSVVDGKPHREKTGWTGWITKHRLFEGSGWPAGALLGSIVLLIMELIKRG